MIQIYSPNNVNYRENGNTPLIPTKADLTTNLNGAWLYTLEHPLDDEGRWKYIEEDAVIKAPSFNGEQLFRIKSVKKTAERITAQAQPIFYDAADDLFLTDVRPTNKNGQDALDLMLAPSNGKYTGSSDISTITTAYFYYRNFLDCLNGNEDPSFIKRWGGEIIYDNYNIFVNRRAGGDYGAEIRYGKNIPVNGFTEEIDTNDIVTRIYPTAFNGRVKPGTPYVDSPLVANYPTINAKTIAFENIKLKADASPDEIANPGNYPGLIICNNQTALNTALTNACNAQYDLGIDKPKVTITANLVLLHDVVGYEEYQDLVGVGLGDTVKCRHSLLDITTEARVIALTYDSIGRGVTSVTIGEFNYNYFSNVTSAVQRVQKAIRADGSVIAEKVQGFIDGALAQLRLQSTIAQKQDVRAILFEDLDPSSPTYGAMALGTQGFQISKQRTADGNDWVWSTFGTADGFNADYITAGTLEAITINGGTITGGTINGTTITGTNISGSTLTSTRTYTSGGITITDTASLGNGKITASSTRGSMTFEVSGGNLTYKYGTGASGVIVSFSGEGGITVKSAVGNLSSVIGTTYISTGTLTATEEVYGKEVLDQRGNVEHYSSGDTVTANCINAGHVTNSTKSIDFFIPLPKRPTTTPEIDFSNISVRGPSGYVDGSQYITLANYTPTITLRNTGLQVRLTKGSAITNISNNQPVSVAGVFTISF